MRSLRSRVWLWLGWSLGAVACGAPSPAPAPARPTPYEDRASLLSFGAILLDVRLVGAPTPGTADDGATRWEFVTWNVATLRQLAPTFVRPFPAAGRMVQALRATNTRTQQTETFTWGPGILWRPALRDGGRYLVVDVMGSDARAPGALVHHGLYALTDDGRLAEPALGFPTGADVSAVLDPTGLDPLLVDAGAADAP